MNDALGGVQTVLVLGGSSELGLATLRHVDLRPGSKVLLAGRSEDRMLQVAREAGLVERTSVTVTAVAWDVRRVDTHGALLDAAVAELGEIDLVLATAGVLGVQERAEQDLAHAADILETNFVGLATALLPVAQRLREQGHGVIVVFSSVAALRGRETNFIYGSSKAGLDVFAEGLAASLAGSGARVITVRPGFVRGRMTAGRKQAPMSTVPDSVGQRVAAALRSGADVIHVPRPLGPVFLLVRTLPARLTRGRLR